jgi:hypothetical protein
MSKPRPIEYADASIEVGALYDDIKTTRNLSRATYLMSTISGNISPTSRKR